MSDLPPGVTRDQQLLRAVCDRLDAQNELLAQIRDRLPEPARISFSGGQVELREPASPPSGPDGGGAADTAPTTPATPARRARKPSGKAATASKETP
ncbi:hypothetical protein [Microbispora sp. GKU 823]|uniref:hypothetical protein n=1 Tax=Microbispora sp. GKU 823 TaxID=1652100 RepID=UPI0009A32AE8|nr:hypothetical protein [Microbispora sp. GKU 823]OPG13629.1 hypothetical protein B1L11_06485 [Microbispora sp. GKU 823]